MSANAEFLNGAGPFQDDDISVYDEAVTDFDIQTVAGNKYFHRTGHTNQAFKVTGATMATVNKTYGWPVIIIQIQNVFTATGDRVLVAQFGVFMQIHVICTTDTSHYKFRLYTGVTQIGSDSSEFAVGASDRVLRGQMDGTNWKLDIDGTEEISGARTTGLSSATIILKYQGKVGGTQTNDIYWRTPTLWQSNSSADRPGTTVTGEGRKPNGDMVSEYDDESCAAGADAGTYTKWNQIPGAAIDDTTFNCGVSVNAEREISDFENTTLGDVSGVTVWARGKTNDDPKITVSHLQERDASDNIQENSNGTMTDTTWLAKRIGFPTAPDATEWSASKFNATGFGLRSVDTNDGHDQWSTLYAEVFDIDDDPTVRTWPQRRPIGVGHNAPVRQAA